MWISSQSVGAGSRSSADFFERAAAALPLKLRCVPQIAEQRRIAIDRGQFLLTDTAGGEGKEAAREDFALVRDEDESLAIVETARRAPNCVIGSLMLRGGVDSQLAFSDALLQKIAPVMLRLGRFDIETCSFG